MKDIIIEIKRFREEVSKASSDCWISSNDERNNTSTYGITLDRIIEIAFDFLIETQGSWSSFDPMKMLEKKLFQKGFKKLPMYKSEKELYQMICDFNHENAISGGERAVLNALKKVSADIRWDLYKASYKFIDGFLFNIES